jgi:hypothetical protein
MPDAWSAPDVKRLESVWVTAWVMGVCTPVASGISETLAVNADSLSWVSPDVEAEQFALVGCVVVVGAVVVVVGAVVVVVAFVVVVVAAVVVVVALVVVVVGSVVVVVASVVVVATVVVVVAVLL